MVVQPFQRRSALRRISLPGRFYMRMLAPARASAGRFHFFPIRTHPSIITILKRQERFPSRRISARRRHCLRKEVLPRLPPFFTLPAIAGRNPAL